MILIEDAIPFRYTVEEAESVGNSLRLRGLFQMAEKKNINGRIYPKAILKREVERLLPAVRERRVLGEIDHPNVPQISLQNASHVITDLRMDGNKVFGEIEVISTPSGKVLKGLIESGIKLGISSRGVGSLSTNESGVAIVQEDFRLSTWDVVVNPSTHNAWLNESANDNTGKVIKLSPPDIVITF